MKTIVFWLVNIVIPLLAGTIFYALYQPDIYTIDFLEELFDIDVTFDVSFKNTKVLSVFKCYFSDMCWSYSFTAVLGMILGRNKQMLLCAISINAVVSITIELLQKFNIINGTFDFYDILIQILCGAISAWIIYTYFGGNKK